MIEFTENNEIKREEGFRAVLVGVATGGEDMTRSMEELEALVEAAGGETVAHTVQNLERPAPATYIGKGKVEELADFCESAKVDTAVFDNELSGAQMRNLEDALGVRVIDRTILILDIFAARATSKEGKLQVELAQLAYRRPRLMGFGKSLSRLGGGIGTRGPGEKKLETDRRHIDARMEDIKPELKKSEQTGETKSAKRRKSGLPVVALVGYTNAGKSALMNALLKEEGRDDKTVFSKNMLFATLDAEQRLVTPPSGRTYILSDTVGFVSKLPHALVKAFRATLEEAVHADLLLHVVDVTAPEAEFCMDVTEAVLKEIGAAAREQILVYNKMDLLADPEAFVPSRKGMMISAKTGEGLDDLAACIDGILFADILRKKLLIPYHRGDVLSYLCGRARVFSMEHKEEGTVVDVELSQAEYGKVAQYDTL